MEQLREQICSGDRITRIHRVPEHSLYEATQDFAIVARLFLDRAAFNQEANARPWPADIYEPSSFIILPLTSHILHDLP